MLNTLVLTLATLVIGFAVGRVRSLHGFQKNKPSLQ